MATKQEWLDYLELEAAYVKEMKDWVKKQSEGDIVIESSTQDGGDNPPVKPPNP